MKTALSLFAVLFLACATSAWAEGTTGDLQERLKLSQELHDIRKIRDRINDMIEAMADAAAPEDRDGFIKYIGLKVDFDKLEQASITYAAETYTVPELKAMIAYFGSVDGQSAEAKGELYSAKINKDIMKEVDAAMMAAKLGETPEKAK